MARDVKPKANYDEIRRSPVERSPLIVDALGGRYGDHIFRL